MSQRRTRIAAVERHLAADVPRGVGVTMALPWLESLAGSGRGVGDRRRDSDAAAAFPSASP